MSSGPRWVRLQLGAISAWEKQMQLRNWSLEARLHRPTECGCRVLHGEDSASTVGAYNKGRSSSYSLNLRCRRRTAIVIAGGLEDFHGWLSTDVNPADEPSRRMGTKASEEGSATGHT